MLSPGLLSTNGTNVPCYHPLKAWKAPSGVHFRPTPDSVSIQLPCGNCIGCRLERSRQWAVRLVHENRFHDESSFITLTYDEDHLPKDGSLNVKHWQDFMKRLRFSLKEKKLRFFHCGEYGEKKGRPHYHAIVFGECFRRDSYDLEHSDRGDLTWRSKLLDSLWPFGLNRVGDVTFESCAYVARYVTKKVNGRRAKDHYERIDEVTGEIFQLKPEYCTMSRRPGIGAQHFERYIRSIYPSDTVVARGVSSKPPKFYDKLLEKTDPALYAEIKEVRECALATSSKADRSERRLADREIVKLAQISSLKRRYEVG